VDNSKSVELVNIKRKSRASLGDIVEEDDKSEPFEIAVEVIEERPAEVL